MTSPLVTRMHGYETTVFAEMSRLAVETGAVNLGQGFPDTDGPSEILEAARRAISEGRNQYPPGRGVPELLSAVADHQAEQYGIELDPSRQVLVTAGATEAIAASILALCESGDEVVVFEPYYDSYTAMISLAGAHHRTCVLRFPEFSIDADELRAAFSARTRLVLLNNPHNPTGKVFNREELQLICDLAREFDAWVVTDEVYEHMTYDDAEHIPVASLPQMADRTLTISSAGKTFSVTGWKIGWISGPAEAITAVKTVKQYLTFVSGGPFQPAVAHGLGMGPAVFDVLRSSLQQKRDRLVDGLVRLGVSVTRPAGTYFAVADVTSLGYDDGGQFCLDAPGRIGVAAVPLSGFHDDPEPARKLVRFAFCKRDHVLDEGLRRIAQLS